MPTPTRRFVDWLIAWRYPLFALAIALAAAAYSPSRQVRFDRSIEKMFAPDDPLIPPYERLKREFGGNEIVMAVYTDPDLLKPDGSGLARLKTISDKMKQAPGVKDVLSLAEVNTLLESLQASTKALNVFGMFGKPKPKWDGPAILNPDSQLARDYLALFQGYTHGADGKTVSIACMLDPAAKRVADTAAAETESQQTQAALADDPRRETIRQLRENIEHLPDGLAPGVLAGEPVMVVEGFRLLEIDGQWLGIWSTILLGLTILACFRSVRWLVMPIAVVQWTLVLTQATLVWSGLELTMVSSMLTAIVTVVGIATVMHIIVRFRELRRTGLAPSESLAQTGMLLLWPIVGAIATDMAGFGSLWWASVGPVQDFGTMMVVGSLLVLPACALLVPALVLVGYHPAEPAAGWGEASLDAQLGRLVAIVEHRPRLIAVLAVVVALLAGIGSSRLEVETDFTKNFRASSQIAQSYNFVETNLGVAGVWYIIIPAPLKLNDDYLARVRSLETKLREIPGEDSNGTSTPALTKVLSLADALDAAKSDALLAQMPSEMRAGAMALKMPAFLGALRSTAPDAGGEGALRIMLRARERQSAQQKQRLIEEATRLASEAFPATKGSRGAEVTGFFVLLTNLIESMLRDQWTTFGIATAGIAVLMLISFRSVTLMTIALVPNLLPVFVVMGLLGWLGLKINMGAAMIAAVSMGLSVDSSIHYIVSYRRARVAGKSVRESLEEVQSRVGRAMVLSTLALIVGFAVLCTSEFIPTVYFGALVSLAMLGGLAGNLVILPLLLSWTKS
jgi:predicted RND superfamily exporter protein